MRTGFKKNGIDIIKIHSMNTLHIQRINNYMFLIIK